MKNTYIKLTIFILLIFEVSASDWRFNAQAINGLDDMVIIDSTHAYIVGFSSVSDEEREVVKSDDGGRTWDIIYNYHVFDDFPPALLANIHELSVPDTNTFYFVTTNSTPHMKKSIDGGKSFKAIKVDVEEDLEAKAYFNFLSMYDANIGFVRWKNSASYMTDDGWQSTRKMPEDLFLYKQLKRNPLFLDSNTMLIFLQPEVKGGEDLVIKYKIKEHTRELLYKFKPEDSFAIGEVEYISDDLVYLVGGKKNGVGQQEIDKIWKVTDGLTHWEEILSKEVEPIWGLSDISFYDKNNGIATGKWGKIALTNDGGKTWEYDNNSTIYNNDLPYGPPVLHVKWAGKRIIIGTNEGKMYEYTGDYFKFEQVEPFYFAMKGEDKYCFDTQEFELDLLEPKGGSYSGDGISNNRLNCGDAGAGTHQITYSYTDENKLTKDTTISIEVYAYLEAPVIKQSVDTLSTQYDMIIWYAEIDKDKELSKSKVYMPETEGYYLAKYIDENICTKLSDRFYYSPSSVYSSTNKQIKIENEILTISSELLISIKSIKIYDLKGKLVYLPKLSKEISLEGLNKGIYSIQILGSSKIEYLKYVR